jgi:hypothetical protein
MTQDLDDHIPSELVMEIVKDGHLEVVDIKDIDGPVAYEILRRELFGHSMDHHANSAAGQLELAWSLQAVYADNMRSSERISRAIRFMVLALNVVVVACVAIQQEAPDQRCKSLNPQTLNPKP